jgi:hypothetical protein
MKISPSLRSRRGSVLLVALIFAFVIALALTSYMKMASSATSTSQRAFLANDSMNVTEAGIEDMLWTCNKASDAANSGTASTDTIWSGAGWTLSGNDAYKVTPASNFSLSQNATGTVKVYVQNYNSTGIPTPTAIAKSIVTPSQGPAVIKMVVVDLVRSSFFSTGLVAKDGITFSGNNATVDSYNSNPQNTTPSPNYTYNTTDAPQHANGSIATTNVNAIAAVGNANIYGYVSVGSSNSTAIQMNSNGVISGNLAATTGRDDTRITTNFTESLPDVTTPNITPWNVYYETGHNNYITGAGNCQLPDNSDIGHNGVTVNGVTTYYYTVQYINLTGNSSNVLTIKAGYNVVIKVTGTNSGNAVGTYGSGGIVISPKDATHSAATLAIYTSGNIDISGDSSGHGGVSNSGAAANFQIWGTGTAGGGQTVKVSGNGSLAATVYAPNATVSIVGNGNVFGAVVGDIINVAGEANFHYDESLANLGGSNPFKISKWREIVRKAQDPSNLTTSDRDYYTQVNGGSTSF